MASNKKPSQKHHQASNPNQRPQAALLSAHWSGPLPPPSALAQFNEIIPNGAERIMRMVEHEQVHRITYEKTVLDAEIKDQSRGHWIGGALALACIGGAVYVASIGSHWVVSIALVGVPIGAVVQRFISRTWKH